MVRKIYVSAFILCASLSLSPRVLAQYDQNINVEGKYVPEYIPRDRIGIFPNAVRFPLEKSSLSFAEEGVNADLTPQAIPIPATGWHDSRNYSRSHGYIDFGLGSWLESTLSAGYRFIDNPASLLGLRLQHNSLSLWKPDLSEAFSNTFLRRYDEVIGVYASHNFGDMGNLAGALDYHLGYFNYYGFNPSITADASKKPDVPTQTLNDVAARLEWASPSRLENLTWNLTAGLRYFGMRRLYLPADSSNPESSRGGRETDFEIGGTICFPISSKSDFGMDLVSHILAYRHSDLYTPQTYGTLAFTPYYKFNRYGIDFRLGAKIDLAFNAGSPDKRHRTFNIAPAIKLDYNAGPISLFLDILGGNRLNTLAGIYDADYYCLPTLLSSAPAYSPLDSKIGVSFGPFSGFSAGLDFAYRIIQGENLYGWYSVFLNGTPAFYNLGLPGSIEGRPVSYFKELDQRADLHGFSLGLNLSYDAGRFFRFDSYGSYQLQNGKTGFFNGIDRPRWVIRGTVSSNPWKSLKLNLTCDYRALRDFSLWAYFDDSPLAESNTPDKTLLSRRIKDFFSLNFSASYQINSRLTLWIEADDLTCRHNFLAPGLPEPPLRLAAGLSLLF